MISQKSVFCDVIYHNIDIISARPVLLYITEDNKSNLQSKLGELVSWYELGLRALSWLQLMNHVRRFSLKTQYEKCI